jgi:uncharacterized membrane protein YagU involved in acid resistance
MSDSVTASQRFLAGAAAGLAATIAMTAFMMAAHRCCLPRTQRNPLPPRLITDFFQDRSTPASRETIGKADAYLLHFLFGGAMGALYGLIRVRGTTVEGSSYGLVVWAASYLGWVPAIGALPPAHKQPRERTLLMIAAHIVWGASLETAYRLMQRFCLGSHVTSS